MKTSRRKQNSPKNQMKTKPKLLIVVLLFCGVVAPLTPVFGSPGSDESDVRNAVQHIFDQLKNGQYEALYDSLPSSSRSRLSRDQLVQGLRRSQDMFQLQRIEIGAVRMAGNLAVVDTTMYAHISKPFDADGKLVVQQYLIREDGSWRVATGDNATINSFLKNNPTFARKFPIKKPQAFVNQNGKWIPVPLGRR
jgi:hypothetical protein